MPVGFKPARVRPQGSRALFVVVAVIALLVAVSLAIAGEQRLALTALPVIGFIIVAMWMTLWRPVVAIDDDGVRVVNPLRSYQIPWSAITGTETRLTLTVLTAHRRIAAWAAPRPSRGMAALELRRDPFGLPDFTAQKQFEEQSGSTTTIGVAGRLIERRLAALGDYRPLEPEPIVMRRPILLYALLVLTVLGTVAVAFYDHR